MAELMNSSNGSSGRARSLAAVPRVDLTAMVDLAFLLITFFMLTTTLAKQNAMDLAMPVGDIPGPVSAGRTMTICLGDNGKMLWYVGTLDGTGNKSFVSDFSKNGIREALRLNARNILKESGKGLIVLVKPSDKSKYGDLINILDELKVTAVPTYAVTDISIADLDKMKDKRIY